ncbi:MAG: NAD-dependent epimerase/dehydratase family protein, partial [Deltaproteobacteria bacterium]|nr:NAD-dependent epimerase/dehydratase family protein [Deltaproteobacteria bacterium]
ESGAIIHMAAVTDMGLLRYDDYAKVTVDGSRNVLSVALELNIRNLIYVSTINTIGYGTPEKWAVESDPMKYPVSDSFYARSKKEAERLFIDFSQKENMHVVILNPSFMLGRYDAKPSSGQMVLFGYRKALMLVPKGRKSFVHVRDVAASVIAALEKGRNGEKYILSTQSMTIGEFYELQKTVCGYRQRIVCVPDRLLWAVGKAGDVLRKCGIRTQISTTNVRQICVCEYYDNSKAVSELDFAGTPIADAVRDSVAWFRETKKIK